jgi:hypothetical protein
MAKSGTRKGQADSAKARGMAAFINKPSNITANSIPRVPAFGSGIIVAAQLVYDHTVNTATSSTTVSAAPCHEKVLQQVMLQLGNGEDEYQIEEQLQWSDFVFAFGAVGLVRCAHPPPP